MTPSSRRRLSLAVVLLTAAIFAGAQDAPILARARRAASQLSYFGIRVVRTPLSGTATEKVYAMPGAIRIERPGAIVIETSNGRVVYDKKTNTVHRGPALMSMTPLMRGMGGGADAPVGKARPAAGQGKRGWGQPTVTDGGLVAGRATQLVTMQGPGQSQGRVWIDVHTGLTLRLDKPGRGDRPGTEYEFTQVTYGEQPRHLFDTSFPDARRVDPRSDLTRLAREVGVPAFTVPDSAGLRLVKVQIRDANGRKVLHQTFRTASKPVSLFTVVGPVSQTELSKKIGKGAALSWQANGVTLVLLGTGEASDLEHLRSKVRL